MAQVLLLLACFTVTSVLMETTEKNQRRVTDTTQSISDRYTIYNNGEMFNPTSISTEKLPTYSKNEVATQATLAAFTASEPWVTTEPTKEESNDLKASQVSYTSKRTISSTGFTVNPSNAATTNLLSPEKDKILSNYSSWQVIADLGAEVKSSVKRFITNQSTNARTVNVTDATPHEMTTSCENCSTTEGKQESEPEPQLVSFLDSSTSSTSGAIISSTTEYFSVYKHTQYNGNENATDALMTTEESLEWFEGAGGNVTDLDEFVSAITTAASTGVLNASEAVWPVKHAAVVEGDLVLGGLMMVHEREDSITCGPVMPQGGIQALEAMLYTLDRINEDPTILPNVTLGAHILDDCDKDTYGLEMAVDFIKGRIMYLYLST